MATLHAQPVLTLFLILGTGYLIGNIRIGSFAFGPVAGVLFAGLFLGHFDFRMSPGAQGMTADAMIGNVATAYAITYIFGLAGLIAIIKLLPQVLGIDLEREAKALEAADESAKALQPVNVAARVYRVTNEEVTKVPGKQLQTQYWDKASVVKVRRNGEIIQLGPEGFLQLGDELGVLGTVDYFTRIISKVGEEITPEASTAQFTQTAQIVVINKRAIGKSVQELDIARRFGVLLGNARRAHVRIPLSADVTFQKGDVLSVSGPPENVDLLGEELGHVEREVAETDMVTFAFGIAVGVVIGLLAINVGQLSIGLGSAGGLLVSGLVIGYLRNVYPVFGRMPAAARWILMEFGLLLFMAGVGLRAGADIIETFLAAGPVLVIAGIVVTVTPILVGYVFGRKVLKLHPVLLFGGITGSMTSGASLSVVTKAANSPMPSLGYTGAYAFANVLLTIAGSVILYF